MHKLILVFLGLFIAMNIVIIAISIRSKSIQFAIVANAIMISFMLVLLYLMR